MPRTTKFIHSCNLSKLPALMLLLSFTLLYCLKGSCQKMRSTLALSPAFSYIPFFHFLQFFSSSFISGLLKNTIAREILQNHEKRKKKRVKNANFDITVDANNNQIQIVTKAQVVKILQPLHKSIHKNNFQKRKIVFALFFICTKDD